MSDDNSSVQSYGADADSCIEASDSSHDAPPELSHMMHRLVSCCLATNSLCMDV